MRMIPVVLLAAACSAPTDTYDVDADVESLPIAVAPGLNGEWDDPSATEGYRLITGTIQEAIDAANPGDTIEVQSGDFYEDIVFTVNDVRLDGAGAKETVLYGSVTVDGASVDSARMADFTVFNPFADYTGVGIEVNDAQFFLEDSEVLYWEHGVQAFNAHNSYFNANHFHHNTYGFWADYSNGMDVFNSLFTSNEIAGLTNYWCEDGVVGYNTFVGNAFSASSQVGFGGAIQFGEPTETETVLNNIVVSNFFGINCQNCENDFKSNLVWGNFTNYANDASQTSSDLNLDPVFTDPANFDYTLSAGSPAIDEANGTIGIVVDFEGEARPSGVTYDIGFDEFVQSSYDLLITEVMANAAIETVGEFVEVYNTGGGPIDLAGLVLTDGDDIDTLMAFQGTTWVNPGEYAVIVDPDYDGSYNITGTIVTTMDTNVGNGLTTSDRVTLYEPDGTTTIATFTYPDDPGDGVSMEMVLLAQGDSAGNWRASQCGNPDHSAGTSHCFPPSGDPAGLVVTEVLANALTESTGEYIELYNNSGLEIDGSGLILDDGSGTDTLIGFAASGTLIAAGEHALILDSGYEFQYALPNGITLLTTSDGSALGSNGIANSGESVSLYKSDGTTLISSFGGSFSPTDAGNGISWQRVDYAAGDDSGNWTEGDATCTWGTTPGFVNDAAGGPCSTLLINEVMANPLSEDTEEFVEIFNAGTDDVDLAGLSFRDSNTIDTITAFQGGATVLSGGEFAVLVDAEYTGSLNIPGSAVVVTTTDTTLGNSLSVSDEASLWSGSHRLDLFNYPFNPGNGYSVEQIDIWASDARENWVASTCPTGSSPGQDNCAQGGSFGGSGTSLYEVVITEVMANAIDEDTDEYVEVYNYGATPIDMWLFVLWDGDELDTIHDWWGGANTFLNPGEYAVILDFEYDMVADPYGIINAPVVLTTSDTTVGSGLSTSDEVFLFEPDGLTLIDSFTSPANPGNGVSIEKIDLLGGDIASNWRATSCAMNTASMENCP